MGNCIAKPAAHGATATKEEQPVATLPIPELVALLGDNSGMVPEHRRMRAAQRLAVMSAAEEQGSEAEVQQAIGLGAMHFMAQLMSPQHRAACRLAAAQAACNLALTAAVDEGCAAHTCAALPVLAPALAHLLLSGTRDAPQAVCQALSNISRVPSLAGPLLCALGGSLPALAQHLVTPGSSAGGVASVAASIAASVAVTTSLASLVTSTAAGLAASASAAASAATSPSASSCSSGAKAAFAQTLLNATLHGPHELAALDAAGGLEAALLLLDDPTAGAVTHERCLCMLHNLLSAQSTQQAQRDAGSEEAGAGGAAGASGAAEGQQRVSTDAACIARIAELLRLPLVQTALQRQLRRPPLLQGGSGGNSNCRFLAARVLQQLVAAEQHAAAAAAAPVAGPGNKGDDGLHTPREVAAATAAAAAAGTGRASGAASRGAAGALKHLAMAQLLEAAQVAVQQAPGVELPLPPQQLVQHAELPGRSSSGAMGDGGSTRNPSGTAAVTAAGASATSAAGGAGLNSSGSMGRVANAHASAAHQQYTSPLYSSHDELLCALVGALLGLCGVLAAPPRGRLPQLAEATVVRLGALLQQGVASLLHKGGPPADAGRTVSPLLMSQAAQMLCLLSVGHHGQRQLLTAGCVAPLARLLYPSNSQAGAGQGPAHAAAASGRTQHLDTARVAAAKALRNLCVGQPEGVLGQHGSVVVQAALAALAAPPAGAVVGQAAKHKEGQEEASIPAASAATASAEEQAAWEEVRRQALAGLLSVVRARPAQGCEAVLAANGHVATCKALQWGMQGALGPGSSQVAAWCAALLATLYVSPAPGADGVLTETQKAMSSCTPEAAQHGSDSTAAAAGQAKTGLVGAAAAAAGGKGGAEALRTSLAAHEAACVVRVASPLKATPSMRRQAEPQTPQRTHASPGPRKGQTVPTGACGSHGDRPSTEEVLQGAASAEAALLGLLTPDGSLCLEADLPLDGEGGVGLVDMDLALSPEPSAALAKGVQHQAAPTACPGDGGRGSNSGPPAEEGSVEAALGFLQGLVVGCDPGFLGSGEELGVVAE